MTKSTEKLAGELTAWGRPVSADTVGRLLKEDGYSLQGNAKRWKDTSIRTGTASSGSSMSWCGSSRPPGSQ